MIEHSSQPPLFTPLYLKPFSTHICIPDSIGLEVPYPFVSRTTSTLGLNGAYQLLNLSTKPDSVTDCMSTRFLRGDQPPHISTVDCVDPEASRDAVKIPLPLELCYVIYELLDPADLLSLGLASKSQLELLEAWKIRKVWGSRTIPVNVPPPGPFNPGRALRFLFRVRGVHMKNIKSSSIRNESKKICLENWLRSDDDWKVCGACLVFLRPAIKGRRTIWRGKGERTLRG